MARERLMIKLRAAAAREYTTNTDIVRNYKDGFTAGWEARDAIELQREIAEIDSQRREAGLADLSEHGDADAD